MLSTATAQSGAQRAGISDQILNTTLWAIEQLEMEKAEAAIPRYRAGTLNVTVVSTNGNIPIPGATVHIRQTR